MMKIEVVLTEDMLDALNVGSNVKYLINEHYEVVIIAPPLIDECC